MRFGRLFFIGFSLMVIVLSSVVTVYAAADPVAYWKFDDGSGTAPVDSSGNNITGSFLTPNPTWSTDVPSDISFADPYSLDFGNYHDGVTFSWPSGLDFSSNASRSFSFWYKPTGDGEPDAGSFDRILSWDNDAFEIAGTFGNVATHEIAFYDGTWRDTGYALTVGTWYHITFTYDGTSAKFYVGNDLKYNQAEGGRALSGTMAIGTRQNGHNEGINGRIDDVRVYNYALTSTQIQNLTSGSNNPDAPPATPTPTPAPTNTPTPTVAPTVAPTSAGVPKTSTSSSLPGCNSFAPSSTPDLFQITTTKTTATLSFSPVGTSTNYLISYGIGSNATEYSVFTNQGLSSGVLQFTIGSLSPNTTYSFMVRGQNGCMPGNWGNTMIVKTTTNGNTTFYKNFVSQVLSFIPQETTVLGISAIKKITPTPTPKKVSMKSISKVSVPVTKKHCFLFICF